MDESQRRQLEADDLAYLWHPFTQQASWSTQRPLVIERGEGPWLFDTDGRKYLDGVSSLWTNVHGHRHPVLDAAVQTQLGKIAHSTLLGLANVPSIQLAKRLVEITPPQLTRVFFSDNGSTAAEVGVKLAYQHYQQKAEPERDRTRFVRFRHGYHGDTIGSVSVGGIDLFHGLYKPLLFDAWQSESPYCYRCPLGQSFPECATACLDDFDAFMAREGHTVAAVVTEPRVQGAGGMITQPEGWLERVAATAHAAGAKVICDEVAVGFGRTGRMFASADDAIRPDILALAKGITGGYLPLAATLATDEIYESFLGTPDEFRTFFHGHTYTGNPLAAAVALASLAVFEDEDTLAKLQPVIAHLTARLAELRAHPNVGDIRQCGVMVGVELVQDRATKESWPYGALTGARVCDAARSHGVIIRPLGDVLVANPPLCIGIDEADVLVNAIRAALDDVLPVAG